MPDADPHRALREDVRLLGDLLGEVLRAREGADIFGIVEDVRAMAKRARAGSDEDFAALAARLAAMPVESALPVAFTTGTSAPASWNLSARAFRSSWLVA